MQLAGWQAWAKTQTRSFGAAARTGRVLRVDGIHDLGGRQGFGAVGHWTAEPVFHQRWEAVIDADIPLQRVGTEWPLQ